MRILLSIFAILMVSGLSVGDILFRNEIVPFASKCSATSVGKRYCVGTDICTSRSLTLCFGITEYAINCTDTSPYCVEATAGEAVCSATPPSGCSTTGVSDFSCTGEGLFPDPLDCKKFHYCFVGSNGLTSQSGTCADRYVFDPDSPSFCRLTNNYYCTLPNCKNVSELKNVQFLYNFYPYNRQYVALCIPNQTPLVFKCDKNFTPNLSAIPITCEFKCTSAGLFPNPKDNTKYYECLYNSQNQLVAKSRDCFVGWIFVTDHCQQLSTTTSTTTSASTSASSSESSSTGSSSSSSASSSDSSSSTASSSDSSSSVSVTATSDSSTT